ncbi:MAG: zinc carboxypeptidase, partial [Verrucomicrobiales bacterium]|nr:zinc carboxypeptidase [Verrucomicrobiales bacterium]
ETTEIFIVPIMDVDRVATGDGGKEANPRDHNRDWTAEPVYPEVAAAQARLLALVKDGRLKLFLDLHNPAPGDKHPFFFVGPEELLSPEGKVKRAQFMEQAFAHLTGPLAAEKRLRTTGASYHPLFRQISGMWVDANGNPDTVAACLETSWNTPHSTTAGYRDVGQKLAQAAAAYLKHR